MHLKESGEMYLETLLILSKKQSGVRSIDLVDYMGFTKPSVSRAVGLLKDGGYIIVDDDGFLHFTAAGKEIAEKIYTRHIALTDFLVSIGVDKKVAAEDACKIEHDISEESFQAILHSKNIKKG
jgi:Mn-dependent DtxR family transcriptional regulator